MDPQIIEFENDDGSSNAVRYFKGSGEKDPILIQFPALGMRAVKYDQYCKALAHLGFNTYVVDLRGLGASSIRPKRGIDFGYKTMLE